MVQGVKPLHSKSRDECLGERARTHARTHARSKCLRVRTHSAHGRAQVGWTLWVMVQANSTCTMQETGRHSCKTHVFRRTCLPLPFPLCPYPAVYSRPTICRLFSTFHILTIHIIASYIISQCVVITLSTELSPGGHGARRAPLPPLNPKPFYIIKDSLIEHGRRAATPHPSKEDSLNIHGPVRHRCCDEKPDRSVHELLFVTGTLGEGPHERRHLGARHFDRAQLGDVLGALGRGGRGMRHRVVRAQLNFARWLGAVRCSGRRRRRQRLDGARGSWRGRWCRRRRLSVGATQRVHRRRGSLVGRQGRTPQVQRG